MQAMMLKCDYTKGLNSKYGKEIVKIKNLGKKIIC